MKKVLKLKEWAEERDAAWLEIAIEDRKESQSERARLGEYNSRLQELYENAQYNLRYLEEKEEYSRNLEAKKAYYNLSYRG